MLGVTRFPLRLGRLRLRLRRWLLRLTLGVARLPFRLRLGRLLTLSPARIAVGMRLFGLRGGGWRLCIALGAPGITVRVGRLRPWLALLRLCAARDFPGVLLRGGGKRRALWGLLL